MGSARENFAGESLEGIVGVLGYARVELVTVDSACRLTTSLFVLIKLFPFCSTGLIVGLNEILRRVMRVDFCIWSILFLLVYLASSPALAAS